MAHQADELAQGRVWEDVTILNVLALCSTFRGNNLEIPRKVTNFVGRLTRLLKVAAKLL